MESSKNLQTQNTVVHNLVPPVRPPSPVLSLPPKLLIAEQQQIAQNSIVSSTQHKPIGPPITIIAPTIVNQRLEPQPPSAIPPSDSIVNELNNAKNFMEVAERLQLA